MVRMVNPRELFFYLLTLTCFFLFLEISFFIQYHKEFFGDFNFVSHQLIIPFSVKVEAFYFILIQLLIHLAYCIFIWGMTLSLLPWISRFGMKQNIFLGIGIWLWGIVTLLLANSVFFPNSRFASLINGLIWSAPLTKFLFFFFASGLILLLLFTLINFVLISYHKVIILSALMALIFVGSSLTLAPSQDRVSQKLLPNIIIVGIDALRPDFLGFFGSERSAPFLDGFLNQSIVFSEAVTPLARTFPSWSSILTGRYPKEINIRSNLSQQDQAILQNTLPKILRNYGYETIYATDETRFSNISTRFGFDHIVTPTIGLSDFLLGTLNDFPFSNFIINTSLGQWLFPYSYANRAAFATYQPSSFLKLVQPILEEKRTKPLFLAIHFCLTHYPYLWADFDARQLNVFERYRRSVFRIDQQVSDFFNLLQQSHLLDYAIVIILSDHGEALEFAGDRMTEKELFLTSKPNKNVPKFYPPNENHETVNQSAGHGTDVLGMPQYHTLLAIKLYGIEQVPHIVRGVVSLLDIKPTILELVHIPIIATTGQSLAAAIKEKHDVFVQSQPIFLESDFSPPAIRTVYPQVRHVLLEGIQIFEVDPRTAHLIVKPKMRQMIIESKQYAVIDRGWMLALYPQNKNYRMPILINLKTGQWTNDMKSQFVQASPAHSLFSLLKNFYGTEIKENSLLNELL